ncbi:MAG: hypothetical protein CMJ50_08575 [Planctomycetaceae bacterium]|nr:hypothetical protein [Planctomycetaceae bacterium]
MEPGFAVGRSHETILGTPAIAGKAQIALAAITRQGVRLLLAELPLKGPVGQIADGPDGLGHHLEAGCVVVHHVELTRRGRNGEAEGNVKTSLYGGQRGGKRPQLLRGLRAAVRRKCRTRHEGRSIQRPPSHSLASPILNHARPMPPSGTA